MRSKDSPHAVEADRLAYFADNRATPRTNNYSQLQRECVSDSSESAITFVLFTRSSITTYSSG